ncbi:acetylajmalan esterase-like [Andrographis paniculata]|uniref:acetylajmalan esterase-like n=1 Tax=Andrographis paniculata TaxID=175694 RepID=UPI0021E80289|nr:acetylajmalan esterase-like [Andrographis paniculata]
MTIFPSSFVCLDPLRGIRCPIKSIYQLGDSTADTGNLIRLIPAAPAARLPYGETFPRFPSGRWSDGRLIIDYIAASLGLPPLNPNLDKNATFFNGVNFAVAGSTTLSPKFYAARGTKVLPLPSLFAQLAAFKKYLKKICLTPADCKLKLRRSLVFVGEFGYNDIAYAFQQGKSLAYIETYLPLVNGAILNATREVILLGADQVIVPGLYPLGCFPFSLSSADRDHSLLNERTKDEFGCLKGLNDLIRSRNNDLERDINKLRLEFPNVNILYSDLYNAFLTLLIKAPALGFNPNTLFKPCCGRPGFYLTLGPIFCGNGDVPLCPNPNDHIHWDGIHLTQASYKQMARFVIRELKAQCI